MTTTPKQFRTATGQTGRDAYVNELAAIENSRRELDARMGRLMEAMKRELPDSATYEMSIASERFPDATTTCSATTIRKQLDMIVHADAFSIESVREILSTLSF